MSQGTRTLVAGGFALALGLLACSDSNSPSGSVHSLTAAQADSMGELVATDAGELADASAFDAVSAIPLSPRTGAGPFSAPCTPTLGPLPVVNSDGDAVPDSLRFSYACSFTRGAMTHTLAGLIDVIDPEPTVTGYAMRSVFTNFGRTMQNSVTQRTTSAIYNGSRQVGATADTLGHTLTQFTTSYTYGAGQTATHVRDWIAKFTADVPGSILLGNPLPAGDVAINGTSDWTKNARSWNAAVTTVTPLHYNPACAEPPRFDAGELNLVVTRDGNASDVTIQFPSCGQYTVTRTAVPAT